MDTHQEIKSLLEVKTLPDHDSKTKPPRGTESQLAERKAKLEAELEATRQALKAKRLQKTTLKKAAEKKERTRLLIIGGLTLAEAIRHTEDEEDLLEKNNFFRECLKATQEKATAGKPPSEKQKKKFEEDRKLFDKFLNYAALDEL